ncbi:hypothetical protein SUGI_0579090 [Cryptomeria japonica]|nr:hypothetical protein SUGI_0579090 [Cryptomeria japonica]
MELLKSPENRAVIQMAQSLNESYELAYEYDVAQIPLKRLPAGMGIGHEFYGVTFRTRGMSGTARRFEPGQRSAATATVRTAVEEPTRIEKGGETVERL